MAKETTQSIENKLNKAHQKTGFVMYDDLLKDIKQFDVNELVFFSAVLDDLFVRMSLDEVLDLPTQKSARDQIRQHHATLFKSGKTRAIQAKKASLKEKIDGYAQSSGCVLYVDLASEIETLSIDEINRAINAVDNMLIELAADTPLVLPEKKAERRALRCDYEQQPRPVYHEDRVGSALAFDRDTDENVFNLSHELMHSYRSTRFTMYADLLRDIKQMDVEEGVLARSAVDSLYFGCLEGEDEALPKTKRARDALRFSTIQEMKIHQLTAKNTIPETERGHTMPLWLRILNAITRPFR